MDITIAISRHLAAFAVMLTVPAAMLLPCWALAIYRQKHPHIVPPPRPFIDRPDNWFGDAWQWVESEARWYASADYLWFLPIATYVAFGALFYWSGINVFAIAGSGTPAGPVAFPSRF